MPETPLSLVREEFEHVPGNFGVESALGWRGGGLGHPGHDCWTFREEWVPKLVLGFTMVGVSMVATDLMQALHAHSGCKMALSSPQLTFHYVTGDSVVKHPQNQRAQQPDLHRAVHRVELPRNFSAIGDVLQIHPDYAQCWFNHQAEWSSYGYNCAATIEHLPHEYKLLWHNSSGLNGPGRSDCNLPTLCFQCRGGRDGSAPARRPDVAAAMRMVPMRLRPAEPSLVTLPTERAAAGSAAGGVEALDAADESCSPTGSDE